MRSGLALRSWRRRRGLPLSTSPGRTSARKRSWPKCLSGAAIIRDWRLSSRRWRRATATDPGATRRAGRRSSSPTAASACTTTFISSMTRSACVACARRPGVPSGCSSIATDTGSLARRLTAAGIGFTLADDAFVRIDDWERAQTFADALAPQQLHRVLDRFAKPSLSGHGRLGSAPSLEPDAGGVRHGPCVALRRDARAALRAAFPPSGGVGEGRARGELS